MSSTTYYVRIGEDRDFEVRVRQGDAGAVVSVGDDSRSFDLVHVGGDEYSARLDGRVVRFEARREGERWILALAGRDVSARVETERERRIRRTKKAVAGPSGPHDVASDMAGIVVDVRVAEGEAVETGTALVVIEAMKMENEIRATAPGTVTKIHVANRDTVSVGDVLVSLG